MTDTTLRTVVRRETHSPRTVAMLTVVVLLLLALVYAGTEIVLAATGSAPLLIAPGAAFDALADPLGAFAPGAVIAAGIVLALVGLILVVLALKPGRLSRHEMEAGERAVVVDNGVVASALAQRLSADTGIARDDIVVGVAHRSVDVTVRPPLGIPVDAEAVRRSVETEIESYRLTPSVRTRVRIDRPKNGDDDGAARPAAPDRPTGALPTTATTPATKEALR
ncbi:DUF6286 domain-containing protein [Microbacterium sp. LMI1-1-1.1]|uniref:DUF6286 domain-containing protein n=1 Tax=Microbacterium sp. LMI1-1-1.1 TaxID=3135223 RepID=UPI00346797CA